MKKVLLGLLFLMATATFTSCTETINSDDETVLEVQATDKEDVTNPNNGGDDCPDPTDPTCE